MSKFTTSNTFMAWSSPTEQKRAPSALTAMLSITPAHKAMFILRIQHVSCLKMHSWFLFILRWLRKCFTNSIPSSSFFFQNLTWPSWLAVMTKSDLKTTRVLDHIDRTSSTCVVYFTIFERNKTNNIHLFSHLCADNFFLDKIVNRYWTVVFSFNMIYLLDNPQH